MIPLFFKVGGAIKFFQTNLYKLKLRRASAYDRAELMRGKFYYLGKNVELYTLNFGTEPYLISIHDNVICAADVCFLNHDVSVFNVSREVIDFFTKLSSSTYGYKRFCF